MLSGNSIFYRFETNLLEKNIYIGPYTFLRSYKRCNFSKELETMCEELKYEFTQTEMPQIKDFSIEYPASFIWPSVGPRQDPYLRDFYKSLSDDEKANYFFGFSDYSQVNDWLCGRYKILELMNDIGFNFTVYKSKYVQHGLRQTICPYDKPYEKLITHNIEFVQKELIYGTK